MKSLKILIVDDSELMRQLLGISVSRLGKVTFDEAQDGLIALKLLATNDYDLIIADINMPVMDGLKLVRKVRNDSRHKDVPIIIVSTESLANDQERISQIGVDAFLTKPVSGQQITSTIKKLLNLI